MLALRSGDEPQVIGEWLWRMDPNPWEIRMARIQQPVRLVGCQGGGHYENRIAPSPCEAIVSTSVMSPTSSKSMGARFYRLVDDTTP